MNKTEFLLELRRALGKLPSYEVEQSVAFYTEMIDDRVEDGMSEADAVAALGPVGLIAAQIIAATPAIPKAIAKANTGSRTLNIVLLAVFSPFWVPIGIALAATTFAIYLSIWAVIVALWATVLALLLCGVAGIVGLVMSLVTGFPLAGFWVFGCGLAATGIGLFSWFGVMAASKGLIQLTHTFGSWIRGLFLKKRSSAEDNSAYGSFYNPSTPNTPPSNTTPTGAHVPPTAPLKARAVDASTSEPIASSTVTKGAQNNDPRA